ncbi:hypothetical protein ECOSU61_05560, partial [Escherichia coli O157:H7 str. LSU-61]
KSLARIIAAILLLQMCEGLPPQGAGKARNRN